MDDEVYYPYIELRTKEILDDGTYIVDNSEQECTYLRVYFKPIPQWVDGKVDFSIKAEEPSNREILTTARFINAVSEYKKIQIRYLKKDTNILGPYK